MSWTKMISDLQMKKVICKWGRGEGKRGHFEHRWPWETVGWRSCSYSSYSPMSATPKRNPSCEWSLIFVDWPLISSSDLPVIDCCSYLDLWSLVTCAFELIFAATRRIKFRKWSGSKTVTMKADVRARVKSPSLLLPALLLVRVTRVHDEWWDGCFILASLIRGRV